MLCVFAAEGYATTPSIARAKPAAAPNADPKHAPGGKPAAGNAAGAFIVDAREAVHFRAVAAPTPDALEAEITAGGAPVTVEFLHQHFGDSEQIRGYKDLVITIWFHVRTYHAWIDVRYAVRRPGADKLSSIFEGAFPEGYCRSQEEFASAVASTLPSLPDLMTLGECVGTVPVPATSYGIRTVLPPPAAAAGSAPGSAAVPAVQTAAAAAAANGIDGVVVDGGAGAAGGAHGGVAQPQGAATAAAAAAGAGPPGGGAAASQASVSVRRFQLSTAPAEVKALHARLEPLLLFTIDGANFIDGDDPQWELLLPVLRAEDGGCLVLGLTTLFNFWAYPASCRSRVSQVLVLSPWQGVGLGKALLKLSYDLAKARNCNDLTVEDPTPNLQRVREKLEVEMMRGLPWVAAQADKCLEAAARGQTSWPEWDPAAVATPPATPPVAEPSNGGGAQDGAGGVAAQPEPHAFFSIIGVTPPEKLVLPQDVLATATAAAETRWRSRLEQAEQAAAAAVVAAAEEDGATAGSGASEAAAAGAAGAAGGSGAPLSAATGGSAAGGGPSSGGGAGSACGALVPSGAFVSAITRQLKMHGGQVRVVWEALLWCSPRAAQRPRVRAAVEELVRRRLEAQHFSSVGRAAAAKRLVDIPKSKPTAGEGPAPGSRAAGPKAEGEGEAELDFFMYRPAGRGGADAGAAADAGAVATGRLNLTTVTAETKASRMEELMAERLQQLDSLAAVLNKQRRKPQPQQQRPMPPQQQQAGRQPLLPQPVPQQQQGPVATLGLGGGSGSGGPVAPVPPAGSKRKAADVAAMMKALEGRL
ncbi:hypothetical protein GPECTOR_6g604 [Gonium pectorale]|uniref:histone acetyltransferase n=1 Tax=Gonium pectorale TaxID=33097 RepID=A0A150GUY3_GONPE|nr:hypothetical protein GPECTOR_6g604 [Gonium pectorale]|eukprot:KXZ53687.1 hypothetical protein GPECTOR_6g604 [Gonium pectorale]